MLTIALLFAFVAIVCVLLAVMPVKLDSRPKLQLDPLSNPETVYFTKTVSKRKSLGALLFGLIARMAIFNKALTIGPLGQRLIKDLGTAQVAMTPEEFILVKETLILGILGVIFLVINPPPDMIPFYALMSVAGAYYAPELWLKSRTRKVKDSIVRDLPDTVDLLGLCVNAGLDFMMALKYVVEKSKPSIMIDELSSMMQEINVGKPRRDALRDMARKYELPDLSTFARTLIQADRMGTSVTDALNILSEDMRIARYRRGEAMAMKAPMKMLVPLLFFIFPVVAVLVAGPVFLDFFQNNPLQSLGK